MKPVLVLCTAAVLLLAGSAAAITRSERQGIKAGVHKLGDPKQTCSRLTENFLEQNYGHSGAKGRKICRRELRQTLKEQPDAGFRRVTILKATEDRARVRIVDGDGDRAPFIFVKTRRGWLLDSVDVEHINLNSQGD